MTYKLLLFFLLSLFSIEVQNNDRFSNKVNLKRFIKEYRDIDKNKSDVEISKTKILKLVTKYVDKYNVDLNISDTIFILETCTIEYMKCYGSLWSRKGKIDYIFHKKLKLASHDFFKAEEVKAIFKWDQKIFKSFDEEGRSWLPQRTRFATRIAINKGTIYIDRIKYLY